jgi:flagellar hook-basal body complex protein FliE
MVGTLNVLSPQIGTQPLNVFDSFKIGPDFMANKAGETEKKGSFENYLLDALNYVNTTQQASAGMAEKLVTDPDSVDIHDVTTAMAQASMTLSVAQAVIDRMLTAWNDITTTR